MLLLSKFAFLTGFLFVTHDGRFGVGVRGFPVVSPAVSRVHTVIDGSCEPA